MATVLITGGTGLIGDHLSNMLVSKGYDVIILTRKLPVHRAENIQYALWNVEKNEIDAVAVAKADHIINLAGAGVADKRWTTQRKLEIAESRTKSAALIVKALREIPNKITTVISASAMGWYGADTKESRLHGFEEGAPADRHFLGETCRLWEAGIEPVKELGKRLIKFRIGIVLSENGGALKKFSRPLRFGIATILGSGEQVISWIHIEDLCRMFIYGIENGSLSGVYNAAAPAPVTNKAFMLTLAKKRRGKVFIPVHIPAIALKIALGEMSIAVLKSATADSRKITDSGFTFLYPTLTAALHLK
jgi:uncharacterized protein (TIGR01777 family)